MTTGAAQPAATGTVPKMLQGGTVGSGRWEDAAPARDGLEATLMAVKEDGDNGGDAQAKMSMTLSDDDTGNSKRQGPSMKSMDAGGHGQELCVQKKESRAKQDAGQGLQLDWQRQDWPPTRADAAAKDGVYCG